MAAVKHKTALKTGISDHKTVRLVQFWCHPQSAEDKRTRKALHCYRNPLNTKAIQDECA